MPDAKLIQSLPQIPAPILTAYLETNPTDSRNQRQPPGYLIWLKSQAKSLEEGVPQGERKIFREQVDRLKEYLRVDTKDELFWGLPSLTQLLWIMEEHRPCGVVLVNQADARFSSTGWVK
jgi:hypothetical protein